MGSPGEVILRLDLLVNEVLDDGTTMHIEHDQGLEGGPDLCGKVASHEVNNFKNLLANRVSVLLHFALTHVLKDILCALGPVDLIDGEDYLPWPLLDPFNTVSVVVVTD